ncbi:quinone oxidoreductase [Plectosphaerella cucumerina]|uniref:Quinone oxidoreductase n=1 Tax=Plectosphaerella cucumerina TaxID=40658 RepID=A0A8K0TK18_9PEZI|nr:quinone oxidoreductase [Plectosphaerella cucumerina]
MPLSHVFPSYWLSVVTRQPAESSPQIDDIVMTETTTTTAEAATQNVLLLHGPRQAYEETAGYAIPTPTSDREVLVRTETLGLNPIDWKAPDFNFGIPHLPYIAGRELVGRVVKPSRAGGWLKEGDQVLVISTDYRDPRKAGFQEYVVASDFNTVRIPRGLSRQAGATIGVAYVAAALALGVCMGVDFRGVLGGPDLLGLVRALDPETLPRDIRDECFKGIDEKARAKAGDWLAVWGGSSTSANIAVQLARLAGLRVVTVVDKLRHGLRLSSHETLRPDLLVDSHDPARATEIIRANVGKDLRFGLDTTGRESATALLSALVPGEEAGTQGQGVREPEQEVTPPPSPSAYKARVHVEGESPVPAVPAPAHAHLIGLAALPKGPAPNGVAYHAVPIKVFHEVPAVGEALVLWLERLLVEGLVTPPEVLAVEKGFGGVNRALDRMRRGEIRGGRIVVDVDEA